MELKDGSESLRIKAEIAKRIRAEAKRLDLSFLETLYFICLTYFSSQANQAGSTPSKNVIPQPEVKRTEVESSDDDDDTYVFDMLD